MYAVFKRELFSLLNSLMAYITIGIFLLALGLLLWFFPDTSILDYGYAELTGFFSLAPFLFMFLIPAITMRSFAEERREGTYILLATRPLTDWGIILAKYLACLVLVLFALVPTLIYYYSIPAFSDQGSRYYINIRYKGIRNLTAEITSTCRHALIPPFSIQAHTSSLKCVL